MSAEGASGRSVNGNLVHSGIQLDTFAPIECDTSALRSLTLAVQARILTILRKPSDESSDTLPRHCLRDRRGRNSRV